MQRKLFAIPLLAVISVTVAYGILSSQAPLVHRTGVVTSTNCATWNVASLQPGSASGYVVPAGPGDVLFNCTPTTGVITVSTTGTATPTFVLPTGYAVIALVPHVTSPINTSCTLPSRGLSSGNAYSFTTTGDYDYCAAYDSSTGDLASFSLSWA
jgi:hypothetical protein